jgi:hypothetical protein
MGTGPRTVERGIWELMENGFSFAIEAEKAGGEAEGPLATGSLLHSFFLLEAVANVCVETLDPAGGFSGDVDRLPVLSKFDLFLTLGNKRRQLDRGAKEVQAIRELKSLRDVFVHPRKQSVVWEKWNPRGESTLVSPKTPILGISKVPNYHGADDAVIALRTVHDFFSYIFRRKCQFSRERVSAILFSEMPKLNLRYSSIRSFHPRLDQWLEEKQVRIDYFDRSFGSVDWPGDWGLPNKALQRTCAQRSRNSARR